MAAVCAVFGVAGGERAFELKLKTTWLLQLTIIIFVLQSRQNCRKLLLPRDLIFNSCFYPVPNSQQV